MSAFRESLRFILPLALAFVLSLCLWTWWSGILAFLLGTLLAFVIYFFRDPDRTLPGDDSIVVAAADGLVVGVEEVEETRFGLGRMKRVAIYLSVFDVHVNRSPVTGKVVKTHYEPGKFLDVRHPDCSATNENLAWHLDTPHGQVVVRQIAGLIARRIVAWSKEGETISRGFRFGMIRFGSRTEIYLPLSVEIIVKVGDRVAGAQSPIARF